MARLRYNGLTATLGADLLTADTTITFTAALTSVAGAVPTISGTDYIPLVVQDASGGVLEIIHLTAYTSGATTGTVTRAQESTTAADRASGLTVVNGLTVADVDDIAAGGVSGAAASGIASFTSTAASSTSVDAAVSGVTDAIEDLFLVTRIREAQDGGGLSSPGDRWAVEDAQIGSAGAQGDLTQPPNNVRVRVRRTAGSATGYTVYVHWALIRM